ncbi:HTH_Tnp_Tc3_2 domain-containing protein [Trichonephila clavipes]|nr:HTH_Tnp_Tc3_2 domain-containing protein [Trichonephila clavipes]
MIRWVPLTVQCCCNQEVSPTLLRTKNARRLTEANLQSRCPFCVLHLTPKHWKLCLQRCQPKMNWNATRSKNVVFDDELRFVLRTDDEDVKTWRRHGERCNSTHTVE